MTLPAVGASRARELVAHFRGQPIFVVGDAMLDRFVVGRVTRISPEAPVPIVKCESEYVRLGGAANVAHNLAALGARVTLVSVIGQDDAGRRLRAALARAGIGDDGLVEDSSRPTTEKVRVVTERNQQVARLDYESDADISGHALGAVQERMAAFAAGAKMILVSDYLKGVVTREVMRTAIALKESGTTPVIVDPKIPHLDLYAGASLITPNHHEAESATHRRIRTDAEARAAAIDFRQRARCEAVLITRGEHGMWLSGHDAEGSIPAQAREVADVTGAGDTVVATLSLALAAGASLADAAALANHAASVVVGKFGPATVSPADLLATFS